ncbi:unnamed protein product [Notodromas monacha]|uniref:LysM domain-containing protein n=1 Tax=Notodromas monacha TaxID=399045 RepID=A0A7R9BSH9_9CRUS|nr:unnamed protein product [Notodromas monacha]CAG0919536.1 unnamed protein product [Notodromas monacha]
MNNERTAIFSRPVGSSTSYLRSYGSAGSNSRTQLSNAPKKKMVKHEISSTDTLQGIALKYGVTMEELKRANKLWTNDSICMRKFLDVPVDADAVVNGEADGAKDSNQEPGFEDDFVPRPVIKDTTNCDGFRRSQSFDLSETCPKLFLSRADEAVEHVKLNVDLLAKKSEFATVEEEEEDPSYGYAGGFSYQQYSRRKAVPKKMKSKRESSHDQFFQL